MSLKLAFPHVLHACVRTRHFPEQNGVGGDPPRGRSWWDEHWPGPLLGRDGADGLPSSSCGGRLLDVVQLLASTTTVTLLRLVAGMVPQLPQVTPWQRAPTMSSNSHMSLRCSPCCRE